MQVVKHMNNNSGNQDTLEKTIKIKLVNQPKKDFVAEEDAAMRMNVPLLPLMPLIEGCS